MPIICFNPRPAPKNGATGFGQAEQRVIIVSIHAPLRRTGRPALGSRLHGLEYGFNPRPAPKNGATDGKRFTILHREFQSTPRSEERGDRRAYEFATFRPNWFQSTPRSEERGDANRSCATCIGAGFQSTPRSEERGDLAGRAFPIATWCFNPRPAPKNGATCDIRLKTYRQCFNPRPAPKNGATRRGRPLQASADVSIHAPLRRTGRQES